MLSHGFGRELTGSNMPSELNNAINSQDFDPTDTLALCNGTFHDAERLA
jgi:hypothetical protein